MDSMKFTSNAKVTSLDKVEKQIDFVTGSGKHMYLKWEGREYRAYRSGGEPLGLGALVPDGLIEYICKNF